MDRQVVRTQTAWNDLEAAAFVSEARDAARTLVRFSERGRMVPEFGQPEFRELLVRSYRLIYTVKSNTVQILAFIHQILAFIHGASNLTNWRSKGPGG